MSSEHREKVIAGEVMLLTNALSSLTEAGRERVYKEVGPRRWRNLRHLLAAVAPTNPALRT